MKPPTSAGAGNRKLATRSLKYMRELGDCPRWEDPHIRETTILAKGLDHEIVASIELKPMPTVMEPTGAAAL